MSVSTSAAFAEFASLLSTSGPHEALKYLNGLTDYRYTGVFQFVSGFARSVFYVDRVNPEVLSIPGIPEKATYCCIVRDALGRFTTLDALIDERLADHPARSEVRAYCGIPVLDPEGNLLGTLCHFDEVPRDSAGIDVELMVQVAATLALGRHVPPAAGESVQCGLRGPRNDLGL